MAGFWLRHLSARQQVLTSEQDYAGDSLWDSAPFRPALLPVLKAPCDPTFLIGWLVMVILPLAQDRHVFTIHSKANVLWLVIIPCCVNLSSRKATIMGKKVTRNGALLAQDFTADRQVKFMDKDKGAGKKIKD